MLFAYAKAESVGPSVGIKQLVARGGLLLVAAGLSAGAIGELIASDQQWETNKYIAGGSGLVVAVGASLYFVVVSDAYTLSLTNRQPLEENLNVNFAFWFSLVSYVVAVYVSLVGVWVAAEESEP